MKSLDGVGLEREAPESLAECIIMAACVVPASKRLLAIHEEVLNFINQKFAVAYLKVESKEEENRLQSLYLQITEPKGSVKK